VGAEHSSFCAQAGCHFYLRIGVDELIPRAVFSRGFDYWESGMDLYSAEDMYDSFRKYQSALLDQFDRLAEEYQFEVVDARDDPRVIFAHLRERILRVLVPQDTPVQAETGDMAPPGGELAPVHSVEPDGAAHSAAHSRGKS
jgi:hypothetical protein